MGFFGSDSKSKQKLSTKETTKSATIGAEASRVASDVKSYGEASGGLLGVNLAGLKAKDDLKLNMSFTDPGAWESASTLAAEAMASNNATLERALTLTGNALDSSQTTADNARASVEAAYQASQGRQVAFDWNQAALIVGLLAGLATVATFIKRRKR